MGCDIHTYVEFTESDAGNDKPYWKNLTRNGGSRNYVMFGVLAGVRVDDAKLFDPKGMPDGDLGYYTSDDYWTLVAPEAYPEWADGDEYCSLDQATRWVESGYSVGETDKTGRLRRVSGPDWHSHSWLTTDELAQALDHYVAIVPQYWTAEKASVPAEWAAMLAAMRALEASGARARLIFWFDN